MFSTRVRLGRGEQSLDRAWKGPEFLVLLHVSTVNGWIHHSPSSFGRGLPEADSGGVWGLNDGLGSIIEEASSDDLLAAELSPKGDGLNSYLGAASRWLPMLRPQILNWGVHGCKLNL